MIVGDEHFAIRVDSDADRIIGDSLAADLSQELTLVVEHLYAVGSVVAYEDLVGVIRAAASIGKLQILGAVELVQDVAHEIENDDTHHLALDHHNTTLGVDADSARMLQDIGAELAQKVTVLIVDLNLMSGRAFGDHDIARLLHHRHAVRIQQLTLALAALAELEFEAALGVKNLYAMRVGVGHDYVIVGVYAHARGLRELALVHAELAELAVVDHLGALYARLGRQCAARRGHERFGQLIVANAAVTHAQKVR